MHTACVCHRSSLATPLSPPHPSSPLSSLPAESFTHHVRPCIPFGLGLHGQVGAQIVLLKNLLPEAGLVNGSRGVVTALDNFDDAGSRGDQHPVVRFVGPTGEALRRSGWGGGA